MSEESHKKIFISHSSKDKQIVDIFVDKLLHLGLQIDPNDVAYTSREETGVGTGEDIRKFIKGMLQALIFSNLFDSLDKYLTKSTSIDHCIYLADNYFAYRIM